jgi:chromosome segregation ATPase
MVNKIIIGMLVLLLILMGGVGYYSYTLSQQVDDLSERLTTFEMQQTARIDTVSNELNDFREETSSSINTIKDKITENLAEIDTLKEDIGKTQNRVASLEDEINGVTSQVDVLEERLNTTFAELSHSLMDASEVYEKVIQAMVMIGDGQSIAGSGFIFDTEAHVLTNYHVV